MLWESSCSSLARVPLIILCLLDDLGVLSSFSVPLWYVRCPCELRELIIGKITMLAGEWSVDESCELVCIDQREFEGAQAMMISQVLASCASICQRPGGQGMLY
jgi:hypothetical protein